MKHDKGLLKADKLAAFREWLVAAGFEVRDGKGEFQCLQVKTSPTCWAVVGRNTAGVLSTHPDLRTLINRFNSGSFVPGIKPALIEDENGQFLEDLRDDFAMAALQGLMSNPNVLGKHPDNGRALGPNTPAMAAIEAYRVADAMLEARKAKAQQPVKKSDTWNVGWKASGYNYCMDQAAKALRHLANHDRPIGGESSFNSEHLFQIADELEVTKRELLAP